VSKFTGATIVESEKSNLMAVPMEQLESFLRYFGGTHETIYIDIALSNQLERLHGDRVNEMQRFLSAECRINLINGTLMNFQRKGVAFIRFKKNVILADDMGLGKTIQSIEFLLREKQDDILTSGLIIVPASLKIQWKREIERFGPSLSVQIIEGNPATRADQWNASVDIYIVNYETLCNDVEYGIVVPGRFSHVIVDEASYVKNSTTKRSKCVREIGHGCIAKVAMTGTPLENNIEELWSIGNFVDPELFGTKSAFKQRYNLLLKRKTKPDEQGQKIAQLKDLQKTLKQVMVRRRKSDVLTELPPVTVVRHDVQLSPVAQEMHDTLNAKLRELVQRYESLSRRERNQQQNEILFSLSHQILAKLTFMRELCLMPELIINDRTVPNVKLIRLLEILDEMNPDDKVVVFTEFRRVAEMLHANIPNSIIIHGGINKNDRSAIIDRFRDDPDIRVMVTTSVLQFGVNLQFANYIVNYDLHYNPAKMAQRIDRLHRIGQIRPVTVINLIANNTIEEAIESILIRKYNLFCAVVEGRFVEANFTNQRVMDDLIQAVLGDRSAQPSVPAQSRTSTRSRAPAQSRQQASPYIFTTRPRRQQPRVNSRFTEVTHGLDPRFVAQLRRDMLADGEERWFADLDAQARDWNMSAHDVLGEWEVNFLEGMYS
jgi:SNF2 family DNA or RNA helicase